MSPRIIAAFLLLILLGCEPNRLSTFAPIQGLSLSDLTRHSASVVSYTGHQALRISHGICIDVDIEVTSKGSGLLTISQDGKQTLSIPIYDSHDGGDSDDCWYVFRGAMLDYRFEDVNADGILDLLVRGVKECRNEIGLLSSTPINDTYSYDATLHQWRLVDPSSAKSMPCK